MVEKAEKRSFMNKRQFLALFVLVALLSVMISGCSGMSRIDSFFANGEYMQHSKMIDFGLFFTIFFAMCYLGFTVAFGKGFGKPAEAKGAIVGLSLALALALAFAIVTQTQFSIMTIFPLAKALFFLIIFFILYGLIHMSKVFGEHWGGKLAAAILALMLTYILLSIFTHMVCQMGNNMNDPACESDFFNWIFTVTEGWFDWSGGGGGGSAGGGGGGGAIGPGGGGSVPGGGGEPVPTGPMEGGCRLDLLFEKASAQVNAQAVQAFGERAKALGAKFIYANGFASKEGGEKYNLGLSLRRAVSTMGPAGITTIPIAHGATSLFDSTSYPANRRVVLSTEAISHFVPAPSPGSMVGCELPEAVAADATNATAGAANATNATAQPGEEEGWNKNWLWLLLLIPLLIIWRAVKKQTGIKREAVIAMKDHFLAQMRKISSGKEIAWHNIIIADPTVMGDKEVEDKSQEIIEMLNKELLDKGWVEIKDLAFRYANDLDQIRREAHAFNSGKIVDEHRDDKHMEMIVRILHEFRRRHAQNNTRVLRQILKQWDKLMFYSRLKEVVKDVVHANKLTKEYHVFFNLQVRLKKAVEEFSANEEKILVKLRKTHYSTWFGKRFWGTRHIVKKSGFPWLTTKKEVEGRLEQSIETPPTTFGLIEVTQTVRNLCQELLAKIAEVMDEEQNVTHDAGSRRSLSNVDETGKYDEEKRVIKRLERAIELQKRMLSEDWEPVIDNIDPRNGSMKGHIRYTRVRT
ncbi:hypothetical protein JW898_00505 [Candidatus Woesearchaeota archaeon]|nr:hypothetical protein [Candidatus Woesearchaeota archaeon]